MLNFVLEYLKFLFMNYVLLTQQFDLGFSNSIIVFWIVFGFIMALIIILFLVSRYRKFRTNEFVIHLRSGKVKSAGLGGKLFKLPLIDDVVVIPTTTQQTTLEAHQNLVTRELQDISLEAYLYWRVSKPDVAYTAVSWDKSSANFVENVLRNATEAIIRTTCANMELEVILKERLNIIKAITDRLHDLVIDWGIVIESIEIKEVHILDNNLKNDMEQMMKSEMNQRARIARAKAEEVSRLQEIEVERKVGLKEQETRQLIEIKSKDREISVADRERERLKIDADGKRQAMIIEADGNAQRIKMKKIAEAEGEAEKIKQLMLAQAEGFKEQAKAMEMADERFLSIQMINALPEIYQNVKPEKLIVLGEGDNAFGSLAKSIIPFLNVIPHVSEDMIKMFKKKKTDEK
ncbi:MAG: SPFH domain-containing protein [Promethearchaeota archaeon]